MFKKRLKAIAVCAVSCIIGATTCIGCNNAGDGGFSSRVTGYIATETEVYSTTAELVKDVADSVVEISTELVATMWGMQYVASGAGSGVIIARDNNYSTYYIVTNNHVIDGATQIEVALRSGEKYEAKLVARDIRGDIAVISIHEEQTLNVAVWGNSDELQIGEDLIAIGNPLGSLGGTVTKGILSATARSIVVGDNTMTLLQTDTAINPGNSGGGLFNMRGQLVGVVNAKTSDEEVEGICFAIPSNTARAIVDDLLANGVVSGRASLGVKVTAQGEIVYITDAGENKRGTLELYDKIYSINGKTINSLLSYYDAMASLVPGETAEIIVYRGHETVDFFGRKVISFSTEPTTVKIVVKQLEKK